MDKLYKDGSKIAASSDLGGQYVKDLLRKFQLTQEQMFKVFDYCKEIGIMPFCTPWDEASLAILEEYGMPGYKVASADFTNHPFLKKIAATGKPMICSTGMCTEEEITESVSILQTAKAQYVLLHCNSTYPVPYKDINLRYMNKLQALGQCLVGYSGHDLGVVVSIAAVGAGASVIEKHLTVDRTMEGNDHQVSLLPKELKELVTAIRQVDLSLGNDAPRTITQGELINRDTLAKSVRAKNHIPKGLEITADMLEISSPGKGLQPNKLQDLLGKVTKRNFRPGDFFFPSDLNDETIQARNYDFYWVWGVPVRYHDYQELSAQTNAGLLEFHLSFSDMDLAIGDFVKKQIPNTKLAVHSPELFSGDHLLNLCSTDDDYRARSRQELQRVIDITRELNQWFPNSDTPDIVVNVGGFSLDEFIPEQDRAARYDLVAESLKQLDQEGVNIIPQTMPPFPWHLGGARHRHNLFMNPDEIVEFCIKHDYQICFDISHSQLWCNYAGSSFSNFVEKVGPHTSHLHIADTKGTDDEGLQIGDGEVDFQEIGQLLKKHTPQATFIPEVWQGHQNNGEGFWVALEKLEKFFQ